MKKYLAFFIMVFFASACFASRPLLTDDSGTVDQGAFEVEACYEFMTDEDDNEAQTAGVCLKHGISPRMDFGIFLPYEIDPSGKLGELCMCVKYRILEDESKLPVSLSVGFSPGSQDFCLNLISTKEFNAWTSHFNIGYEEVKEEEGFFTYSIAAEKVVYKEASLVLDMLGNTQDDSPVDGLIGTRVPVSDSLTFDMGVGFGISNSDQKYMICFGMTHGF